MINFCVYTGYVQTLSYFLKINSIATFLILFLTIFFIQLYILVLSGLGSSSTACIFGSRIGALSDSLKCSCLLFFPQLGFCHNFERHIFKHVLDICTCLCTCYIEFKVMLLGKLAALGLLYLLVWKVTFVSYKDSHNVCVSILINLLQPVADIRESLSLRRVINEYNSFSSLVVVSSDSLEAFLSGRVPKLHLYALILHLEHLDFEVDAYGWHVIGRKTIFRKPHQQACFAY